MKRLTGTRAIVTGATSGLGRAMAEALVDAETPSVTVGVAVPDSIIDFRLRRLKALGCNAIRSSHNAPTAEPLDAADRPGFLAMDETRLFDTAPVPAATSMRVARAKSSTV